MKRLAVIANREKPRARLAADQVRAWAEAHGATVVCNLDEELVAGDVLPSAFGSISDEAMRERFAGCDVAVTLGGDGTLLYGVRVVAPLEIPVFSVNLGSVGFHTQAESHELTSCLAAVLAGECRIEKRLLLQVEIESPAPSCPPEAGASVPDAGEPVRALALNDVVISKSAWGHMVHLRLFIDGKVLTDLDADGLVVATPTGSTAYNYAADGPVLTPRMEAIVLNAICPHRMNFAPLVIPADAALAVKAHRRSPLEEAKVVVDGQVWQNLPPDGCLKISRSPLYLRLIVFRDDFYEKLRDRLRWGGLN